VPPRRRVDPAAGRAALDAWAADPAASGGEVVAAAVRFSLEELSARHPGHAGEVRVPPYGAVQCGEGVRHRRGTPPNVVETDAGTWLALAAGTLSWADALASGALSASGERADLGALLPLSSS
jgi:hypothetical protein